MTKRIRLIRNIEQFRIEELRTIRPTAELYNKTSKALYKLDRKLRPKKKRSVKMEQLSLIPEMCTNFYPDHYND